MESINVNQIRGILNRILDKLEFEVGENEIPLKTDFYKLIPTEKWDDVTSSEVNVGSLSDDVIELKKLLINRNRPCTYVDFDRFASLLREISQIMNPV